MKTLLKKRSSAALAAVICLCLNLQPLIAIAAAIEPAGFGAGTLAPDAATSFPAASTQWADALGGVDFQRILGVQSPLDVGPLSHYLQSSIESQMHEQPTDALAAAVHYFHAATIDKQEALVRQAFATAQSQLQEQADVLITETSSTRNLPQQRWSSAVSDLQRFSNLYSPYLREPQRRLVQKNKQKIIDSFIRKFGREIAFERLDLASEGTAPTGSVEAAADKNDTQKIVLPLQPAAAYSEALVKSEPGHATQDFALIGAGVMGKGFAINAAEHGISMAIYDRNLQATQDIVNGDAKNLDIIATKDLPELVASLIKPRRIMLLVPDGKPVESVLKSLSTLLNPGDVVIESGNSFFKDSERRERLLKKKGILFVPMGISGGERGARNGPSLMPGGSPEAYAKVQDVLTAVAGKADDGKPAVAWMGRGGAGHYVKMVHNGIEYAEMQYLAELYDLFLRSGLSNSEISKIFSDWNSDKANSFLLGTAAKVLARIDDVTGNHLVDMIRDSASQKGTGRNTQIESLKSGAASPTIDAAIEARSLSSFFLERQQLARALQGPAPTALDAESRSQLITAAENAFYAAKILAFDQGLRILKLAPASYNLDLSIVLQTWRAGCILQSGLVNELAAAYAANPSLDGVLFNAKMQSMLNARQDYLRLLSKAAIEQGVPTPAFDSARNYYDAFRSKKLPANFIQALRDYFGAHRFSRIDQPAGETFHDPTWENPSTQHNATPQTLSQPPPTKSFHLVIQGAGDVVQKFYSPALKELKSKYKDSINLTVTFIDSSTFWKKDAKMVEKMQGITQELKSWGAQYLDISDETDAASFAALRPDAVVIATPDFAHVDTAMKWLSRQVPPNRVFIEKPLDSDRGKAQDMLNQLGYGSDHVRILDHYGARLLPNKDQLELMSHHLGGGIKSFSYYFVEDHSSDDPNYKTIADRDGAIEREQRVHALNNGMVMDGLPHLFPLLKYFTDIDRIRVTGVRAAQYTGVDGNANKRTEISGETFAEVHLQLYRKPSIFGSPVDGDDIVNGVAYTGKGVRGVKALGPVYDRNAKLLQIVGLNGNRIDFDLRSSSPDDRHSRAYLLDKDGKKISSFPLYPKPYSIFFEKMITSAYEEEPLGLSVEDSERILEVMERILRPIRLQGTLPTYPGGMANRASIYAEDIAAIVPFIFNNNPK